MTEPTQYLIGIHKVGKLSNNEYLYEFLFSDDPDNITDDTWDDVPAHEYAELPDENVITQKETLKTSVELITITEQRVDDFAEKFMGFCYNDAFLGIVALCFENTKEYDENVPVFNRLVFNYAESYSNVISKLKVRNLEFSS